MYSICTYIVCMYIILNLVFHFLGPGGERVPIHLSQKENDKDKFLVQYTPSVNGKSNK